MLELCASELENSESNRFFFDKCLKECSSDPGGQSGPQRYFLFALVSSAIADAEAAEGCRLFPASVLCGTWVSGYVATE